MRFTEAAFYKCDFSAMLKWCVRCFVVFPHDASSQGLLKHPLYAKKKEVIMSILLQWSCVCVQYYSKRCVPVHVPPSLKSASTPNHYEIKQKDVKRGTVWSRRRRWRPVSVDVLVSLLLWRFDPFCFWKHQLTTRLGPPMSSICLCEGTFKPVSDLNPSSMWLLKEDKWDLKGLRSTQNLDPAQVGFFPPEKALYMQTCGVPSLCQCYRRL